MHCEIVDGGCFATVYKFCRTHRCEPDQCPKEGLEGSIGICEGYVPTEYIAFYELVKLYPPGSLVSAWYGLEAPK